MSENILTDLNNIASILEDAIDEQDWSLVIDAYGLLTGREKDEPKTPDNPGDILAELMSRLDRIEGKREITTVYPIKDTKKSPKKNTVLNKPGSKAGSKKVGSKKAMRSTNKFEEMTDIFGEVGKEPGFKKINDKVRPVKRRRPYKPSMVTCVKCNEKFQVSPALARENYQCDDCVGKGN